MSGGYLPKGDSELLGFAQNYSSIITDDPTSVGLTAAIATTLAGYVSDYSTKLTLLETPAERSPVAVQQKDESKRTLSDYIRSTARQIQGTMTVTDAQRTNLRLSVRGNASPINAPTDVPVPEIVSIVGRVVTMNLRALGTDGRAKPAGVDSAAVWTFVGAAPPADITEWEYQGATTKITNFIMTFPASVAAGAQVWLVAQWKNPREMTGPASSPITFNLGGGVSATDAA